ncbi:(2Fe-2S)-binding protein [Aeribacillus composti]|uniref:(2Fe-2S)-binding protein n=1 Tax=Aeribacillus composti TaxID=1868734 RepID=UPI002E20930E|nr:(2Fe-2S)-binding protein [Aeribacillus composti]
MIDKTTRKKITVTVNGTVYEREVNVRTLLSDFLRRELGLTGTHVGCEQGVCGACTILMDGQAVRSCLLLAVQADNRSITTIEGIGTPDHLHPIQEAFWENHGLQCGFCTPGFVISVYEFLKENPDPSDEEIREALSGNLCRCTGYQGIIKSVKAAAEKLKQSELAG